MVKRSENDGQKAKDQVESTGSFLLLMSRPQMRTRILIMTFTMFTAALMFMALLLNVGTFAGDIYVNTIVSGALEIPAKIVAVFLVDSQFLGRRLTNAGLLFSMAISSFTCIPLILTGVGTASTAVSLAGKAIATMAFSIVHVYTAELFPTQIRSVAVGTTSVSSRVAGMIVPYMGTPMIRLWKPLPFLIYGTLGTFAGLLGLLLPETVGQPLLDTIEQAESRFSRSKRVRNIRLATGETNTASPAKANSAAATAAAEAARGHLSSELSPALRKLNHTADASSLAITSDSFITLTDYKSNRVMAVNCDSDKAEVLSDVIVKAVNASGLADKSGLSPNVTDKSGLSPNVTDKSGLSPNVTDKSGLSPNVTDKSGLLSIVTISGSEDSLLPGVNGYNICPSPFQKNGFPSGQTGTKQDEEKLPVSPEVVELEVKARSSDVREVKMTSGADNFAKDDQFVCHL